MSQPARSEKGYGSSAATVTEDFPTARTQSPVKSLTPSRLISLLICRLVPAILLVAFAAPSVTYQLPNYRSNLAEEYQPLQTLKFFRTKGVAFHKYGPMENFLLAPLYGTTILYWKLTGQMDGFSARYPFGFKNPIAQFGFLHLEGRILFLIVGVSALLWFCCQLERVTHSAWIAAIAFLACIGTNVPLIMSLPIPRPDVGMLAFGAMSLGVYLRIVSEGLTPTRAFWFSLLAVLAVTAKELAAPMFVLPCLALCVPSYFRQGVPLSRKGFRKSIFVALLTGLGSYFLLNIVYAPHTWVERMRFWLEGAAVDRAIWSGGGLLDRLSASSACMVNNLGPGGVVLAIIGMGFFLLTDRRNRLLLGLPALSLLLFGLSRLATEVDHYFTIAAVAISPMVAAGLAELWDRLQLVSIRRAAVIATIALLGVNLWYGSACWLFLNQKAETLMEEEVTSRVTPGSKVYTLEEDSMFPRPPASRYQLFGYEFDNRTLGQLLASTAGDLPDVVVASSGLVDFIEGCRTHPARAAFFKEGGFDASAWHGVKSLGYAEEIRRVPSFPGWFPFRWMPAVRTFTEVNTVIVDLHPNRAGEESHR